MSLLQGHWYTQEAKPYLEPLFSTEKVKELNLLPSVTTILKICHSENLSKWKQEQRDLAWFNLDRVEEEEFEEATKRVNFIATRISRESTGKGSFVHAIAEKYWKEIMTGDVNPAIDKFNEYEKKVSNVIHDIHFQMFPKFKPTMVETIVKTKDYAGQVDLGGMLANQKVIIDFKTQTVKKGRKLTAYPNYWAQVAAYSKAVTPSGSAFIILIDPVTLKWKVEFKESKELEEYYKLFEACLTLFKSSMGLGLNV